jgi:NAD(P)-dependent dehydrogenase (short-subunit alcohol dehydrogenase family)
MRIRFDGQIVLVTGATSGIGKATALEFLESGATVILTGRQESILNKLKVKVKKKRVHILPGDITDKKFRIDLINLIKKKTKKLDVLVNAAGIIASGTIENTGLNDFDKMIDINLRSVFHLIQLSIPFLSKTKGNIVNVSSVAGVRAFPGIFSYCVSKAGLDQLTRVAALELAPKGIRVNAVNPGVTRTKLHKRGGMDPVAYQQFLEHSKTTHPLGRVGRPEEVAQLIVFLASDKAGWVTGVTASVDGGRFQTCAR